MNKIEAIEQVDVRTEFVLEMREEAEERGNVHPADFHELEGRA